MDCHFLLQGIFPTEGLILVFRQVERKVSIISGASNWGCVGGGESTDICPKASSPTLTSRELRPFIDRVGGGLHAETAQSSLTVIFKLVISGLTSIILMVLVTVNLQFGVD